MQPEGNFGGWEKTSNKINTLSWKQGFSPSRCLPWEGRLANLNVDCGGKSGGGGGEAAEQNRIVKKIKGLYTDRFTGSTVA